MAFRYKLQKFLEIRIRRKEEQLQAVLAAQAEVVKIEELIQKNRDEIAQTRVNMRKADHRLIESYDVFLKHLYEKEEQLQEMLKRAIEMLNIEKEKLTEREKEVNVLEKHKEKARETYIAEEKAIELKNLSEIGIQKYFAKSVEKQTEEQNEY